MVENAGRGRRSCAVVAGLALTATAALTATPAAAVSVDHGGRLVSTNPADFTPHVQDGSVKAIVQIGSKMYAAGTFTTVRQTLNSPDVARRGLFAFDAETGALDTSFNPVLGGSGEAQSLATDGTSLWVGGTFTGVGANAAVQRLAKLTTAGTVAAGQPPAPSAAVTDVVLRGSRVFVGGKFTSVGASPRAALAAVSASTGAVLPEVNLPFAGTYDGGATGITRLDVSADGSRLAAVGNFTSVAGQPRSQLALLATPSGATATVSGWSTTRFDKTRNPSCSVNFDSFMRDVDFSPDGSWFAVTTTGGFGGGAAAGALCDTTTRWEVNPASAGREPTWVTYTGGDTSYGVAATDTAIYTGGHFRWQNNPSASGAPGPGAVPREALAALDPANGLPLSWNPGRSRGVGAEALYTTPSGLWVGSDTTLIGNPREVRSRVAFLPLAGGTAVPTVAAAPLPGQLFQAQRVAGSVNGVRYRVNAAGGRLQSSDNGPDWTTDAGRLTAGGAAAVYTGALLSDSTVPAGTSPGVFTSERYGTMNWDFPVGAGAPVVVRLHFANRYRGTSTPGTRVFDVNIDGGTIELDDFDIVAAAGHARGTTRSFAITSDGNVDIDFTAKVDQPSISGIEIVNRLVSSSTPTSGALLQRPVDSAARPTSAATVANSSLDWSQLRGTFLVNRTLYYGRGDGGLYARTFDPATGAVGTEGAVNLYDEPTFGVRIPFPIYDVTGIFYEPVRHRLYYTLFGDTRLHVRGFTPESEVVAALSSTVVTSGVDFSAVSGMTMAGGRLLYGSSTDGFLRSLPFTTDGSVSGTPTVVSADGTWRTRGLFVPGA